MTSFEMKPIGYFRSDFLHPYEAPRQGAIDDSEKVHVIQLEEDQGFEQAVEDLAGFERIWLLYAFHQNRHWKPKTMPPRGPQRKRGVFATRSPYRPNPLGLSCVRLVGVDGLRVFVQESDLLDGTPLFDIKPYLPYADSFPQAKIGWLEGIEQTSFEVRLSDLALRKLDWLEAHGPVPLRSFLKMQLEFEPNDESRKRVSTLSEKEFEIAYRTWRARFTVDVQGRLVMISDIFSGYSLAELTANEDPYADKSLHRSFFALFG